MVHNLRFFYQGVIHESTAGCKGFGGMLLREGDHNASRDRLTRSSSPSTKTGQGPKSSCLRQDHVFVLRELIYGLTKIRWF